MKHNHCCIKENQVHDGRRQSTGIGCVTVRPTNVHIRYYVRSRLNISVLAQTYYHYV